MKVKTNTIRIEGISEAARKLGCTKTHLSEILHGRRESRRLREKARSLGIRLPRIKFDKPQIKMGK